MNPDNKLARPIRFGLLVALMTLMPILMLRASVTIDDTAEPQKGAAASTNSVSGTGHSGSKDIDDDDDGDGHRHAHIEIRSDNALEGTLIPIMGILATFGTPVLIVFFVCYFKYRRRRVNVALAQEYLNKGLPVPPQLLDESLVSYKDSAPSNVSNRCQSDLRRGFQLTFIGFGITGALYVTGPHSTTWAWGLIPLIMGVGYMISGWVESRQRGPADDSRTPPPRKPL